MIREECNWYQERYNEALYEINKDENDTVTIEQYVS